MAHLSDQDTLQILRVFSVFRGQKIGCGCQATPSIFMSFVVKKLVLFKIGMAISFRLDLRGCVRRLY